MGSYNSTKMSTVNKTGVHDSSSSDELEHSIEQYVLKLVEKELTMKKARTRANRLIGHLDEETRESELSPDNVIVYQNCEIKEQEKRDEWIEDNLELEKYIDEEPSDEETGSYLFIERLYKNSNLRDSVLAVEGLFKVGEWIKIREQCKSWGGRVPVRKVVKVMPDSWDDETKEHVLTLKGSPEDLGKSKPIICTLIYPEIGLGEKLFSFIDSEIIMDRDMDLGNSVLYFQNIWDVYRGGILTVGKNGTVPVEIKKYVSLIFVQAKK